MAERVVIVGAGPGGLTAGMLLASRGYSVEIFEKAGSPGGRNARLSLGDFHFDTGPTFLLMKSLLEELFDSAGVRAQDYLEFQKIDPLYDLIYPDGRVFSPGTSPEDLKKGMEAIWPGSSAGADAYYRRENVKSRRLEPILKRPFEGVRDYLKKDLFKAMPYLDIHRSLYSLLNSYFHNDEIIKAFAFQAKYIGMSPWKAPGIFSILSWMEHSEGLYHVKGGLNRISSAMAEVIEEKGGMIRYNAPVSRILASGGRASGVELADGSSISADYIVCNADFGYAATELFPRERLRKWTPEKISRKSFSCSGIVFLWAMDRVFPELAHHTIVFSDDYRSYVEDITVGNRLPEDPSFYIHNPVLMDSSMAPEGKSGLFVLVPVANTDAEVDWDREIQRYREKILYLIEKKTSLNLSSHIEDEKIITPGGWQRDYNVYKGAIFNLGHTLTQMLSFRPHNRFEELKGLYLAGGGTHPGSGLPTIYQSGIITAGLIDKAAGRSGNG